MGILKYNMDISVDKPKIDHVMDCETLQAHSSSRFSRNSE